MMKKCSIIQAAKMQNADERSSSLETNARCR